MDKERAAKLSAKLQKRKDFETFSELYEVTQLDVFRIAFSICKNETLAYDVRQEVYLQLYKEVDISKFSKINPDKFVSWLYRVVENKCKDQLRKKELKHVYIDDEEQIEYFEKIIFPQDHDSLQKSQLIQEDRLFVLNKVFERLPHRLRIALQLTFQKELSTDEIADIMDVQAKTIWEYRTQALNQLRKDKELMEWLRENL